MALLPAEPVQRAMRRTTREASGWIERLARLGFAAKGVVYILVGGLAASAAFGFGGGRVTDSDGALTTVLGQPFGRVLLALIALGLAGYSLWRFIQATLDPEDRARGAKGIIKRAAWAISSLVHLGLAVEAARLVLGRASSGSGQGEEADHWAATVLQQPFGPYLLAAIAVSITVFGFQQLNAAYRVELDRQLELGSMRPRGRTWTIRFGRFGLAARGVVFAVIGILLFQAARQSDPSAAVGLAGALRTLQQQPYGPWLLAATGLGLIAYGLFQLVRARYRKSQLG